MIVMGTLFWGLGTIIWYSILIKYITKNDIPCLYTTVEYNIFQYTIIYYYIL